MKQSPIELWRELLAAMAQIERSSLRYELFMRGDRTAQDRSNAIETHVSEVQAAEARALAAFIWLRDGTSALDDITEFLEITYKGAA